MRFEDLHFLNILEEIIYFGKIHQTILKWTSFCFSFDFLNNYAISYVNGKKIKRTKYIIKDAKEMPKDVGMIVRIGHYYWDNRPMIGKIVDVNVWKRNLAEQEGIRYSDCKEYTKKEGDLIKQTDNWDITGNLIKKISVTLEEVDCSPMNTRKTWQKAK